MFGFASSKSEKRSSSARNANGEKTRFFQKNDFEYFIEYNQKLFNLSTENVLAIEAALEVLHFHLIAGGLPLGKKIITERLCVYKWFLSKNSDLDTLVDKLCLLIAISHSDDKGKFFVHDLDHCIYNINQQKIMAKERYFQSNKIHSIEVYENFELGSSKLAVISRDYSNECILLLDGKFSSLAFRGFQSTLFYEALFARNGSNNDFQVKDFMLSGDDGSFGYNRFFSGFSTQGAYRQHDDITFEAVIMQSKREKYFNDLGIPYSPVGALARNLSYG